MLAMLVGAAPAMAASPLCASTSVGESGNGGQNFEWLSRIKINQNSIAVARTGYYDASALSIASLTAGNAYPVEIDVHTDGKEYSEFVKIWLDLDQDGEINPTELVYDSGATNVLTFKTFFGSLGVPATAYNGTMYGRLIMQFNASPMLCGNYEYGATVDFQVDISGGQDNPGAPNPAENVTAVGGDRQAVVSFDLPSSGPNPVGGYVVKSNPGDIEVQGANSPITVPGLTNGTSYTFTVVSKLNTTTFSAPSTPSNAVIPGVATISLSPPEGALSGGTASTAYAGVAVAASGGAAPYGYAVTAGALPAGLTLDPATGAISGTPSAAGTYNFTVTATDNNGATGSAAYSLAIGVAAPVANAVTVTVVANSTNNAITLNLSGGTAISVAVASAASHGTATASGTSITYTPTAGYSGSDSFTYTATNVTGISAPATVTITVTAPTLVLSPALGALAGGTASTAYAGVAVAASGGAAPYGYAVTAGALPAGLTLDPATGAISGTPSAAGTYNFTVTATDNNGATGSAAYSLAIGVAAPVANAVTVTVVANSTNNAITLNLTGGTADSVAVDSQASHGTATASGTSITYTPTAGYSGSDSFTYTATNATGTSAPATVTITVTAPTLVLSPASGALAGGTASTAYAGVAVAASGGAAPYGYAVTAGALPAGLTLDPATGAISGTPSAAGTYNFTVTATDNNGATGSAAYSLAIGVAAPVANAVTVTVVANSTNNAITLNLSGGTAISVAVASAASHGTATASGTSITYTPTAGYSGSDSFTYTATNATGISAPATVTVTVTAPTLVLSPAAGALTGGATGTAYAGVTVAASGGTAPYSYAITSGSLPAGLSLNASTGAISGTPTASGNSTFTVSATDFYGATASASYSIAISAPSPVAFTFSPSGGALTEAMAGEEYSQQITAKGGAGALIYSVASGTLPRGMVLNISTGELTGPLAADAEGDYSFTIGVRDGTGATGTASFTLKVNPRAVAVTDKVVDVPAGSTPNNVYLNGGATGGPFTSAGLTFVEPAHAGTAAIIRGQLAQAGPVVNPIGWYLQFKPNPAFSGQVRIGFRLTSALGVSNTGTVIYNLGYNAAEVVQDIDDLVHGFVQTRQSMISSTIEVPGLMERQRMEKATDPVSTRMSPSTDGLTLGFATSLAQMGAARDNADGATGTAASPFNIWIDGAFLAHNREENGSRWGSFAMVSLGADYLLSEKALLGLSFHYDRMTDPTNEDAKLTGNGWLAGPYASFEIGKNVFWDTSLLYGGSSNDISTPFWDGTFDTRRWFFDSSLKGQWQLDDITVLTPRLRAVYFSEKVEDYAVRNDAGGEIGLDGFAQEQLRVSLGAEIARSFTLQDGSTLTPKLGATAGFSGLDGSGLFGSVSTGLSLQTVNDWTIDAGLLFNIEGGSEKSVGAKVGISTRF